MFYTIQQNNARGVMNFDANKGIDVFVIIEADSEGEARDVVKTFPTAPHCNSCCGGRWDYFDEPTSAPQIYGDNVAFEGDKFNTFVHYQNGDITRAKG